MKPNALEIDRGGETAPIVIDVIKAREIGSMVAALAVSVLVTTGVRVITRYQKYKGQVA